MTGPEPEAVRPAQTAERRSRIRASIAGLGSALATIRAAVARLLAPVRWVLDALAELAEVLWRIPLVVAAFAMMAGGFLQTYGLERASAVSVTWGLAIAMISVPLGLLALRTGVEDPDEPEDASAAQQTTNSAAPSNTPVQPTAPPPPSRLRQQSIQTDH